MMTDEEAEALRVVRALGLEIKQLANGNVCAVGEPGRCYECSGYTFHLCARCYAFACKHRGHMHFPYCLECERDLFKKATYDLHVKVMRSLAERTPGEVQEPPDQKIEDPAGG